MTDSEKLDLIISMLKSMRQPVTGGGAIADDKELDSQYGNFTVRLDPKKWTGPSYIGKTLSECPPDYLAAVADMYDAFATAKRKKGEEDWKELKNAARCRGWMKRNEVKASSSAPVSETDEIPF